ncbi:hypothetical protein C1645_870121 [Glomus cerebriforme]|uniref:Uncharacterized protein n=1 Tax=Glomus cerebriforme TaxID=658196 RepID=A0A397TS06_9GLOM|nr:hypothetical protein C1645_870121 [Glomus cerebriforme]
MDRKLDDVKLKQEEMKKASHYQEMHSVTRTRNAILYNNHQDIELLLTDQGEVPMNYPVRAINIANIPNDEVIGLWTRYVHMEMIILKEGDLQNF